jgi:hypothetical protein
MATCKKIFQYELQKLSPNLQTVITKYKLYRIILQTWNKNIIAPLIENFWSLL